MSDRNRNNTGMEFTMKGLDSFFALLRFAEA